MRKSEFESDLEPGILSIFRFFVGFRAVFIPFQIIRLVLFEKGSLTPFQFWVLILTFVIDTYLLLIYLFLPWMSKKMGRLYLPLALIMITAGSIFETYWVSMHVSPLEIMPEPFIYLFIPLILIAWQYSFKYVLLFTFGTALLEFLINYPVLPGSLVSYLRIGTLIIRTVTFLLVGYIVSRLVKAKQVQQKELKVTNKQLALANMKLVQNVAMIEQLSSSRERNRLARELHDTLAHTLSGLTVQLDAIATLWDTNPQKANRMLLDALSVTRSGLDETRRALQDLRASPLEEMGLAIAVRTLAEDAASRSALELNLDIPGQINNLSPAVEQAIYRIAQEAIQNCLKHANAKQLSVTLKQENGDVKLEVADNGRGFDLSSPSDVTQFGLTGMRERAEMIGAGFEIISSPTTGTMVKVVWENDHDSSFNL
jgi:signal transduction histidine kinase